jgi:DNA-binding NtrC family response regulator
LFADGDRIEVDDLPAELRREPEALSEPPPAALRKRAVEETLPGLGDEAALAAEEGAGLKETVREMTARIEKELIVRALDQTGGNVTRTARLLKISRKSLQTKMKELGLREKE